MLFWPILYSFILLQISFFCTVYSSLIRLILYHISVVTQKYSYLYMHGISPYIIFQLLLFLLLFCCRCWCCCCTLAKKAVKNPQYDVCFVLLLYISWQKFVRTARAQICRGAFPIASCHSMPNSLPKCHGISTLMTLKLH